MKNATSEREWQELKEYIDGYGTQDGVLSFLNAELSIDITRVTLYRWTLSKNWNRPLTSKARRALQALRQQSSGQLKNRKSIRIAHSMTPYALTTVVAKCKQWSEEKESGKLLDSVFDRHGLTVEYVPAASGTEALNLLRDGKADLALADWSLWGEEQNRSSYTAAGCEPLCQVARVAVTGCARWQWFAHHAQNTPFGRTASLMADPQISTGEKPKLGGQPVQIEDLKYGQPDGMSFEMKVRREFGDLPIFEKGLASPKEAAEALRLEKIHCFLGPESWVNFIMSYTPAGRATHSNRLSGNIGIIPAALLGFVNTYAFINTKVIDPAAAHAYLRSVREVSRKLGWMVDRVAAEDWDSAYGGKSEGGPILTKDQAVRESSAMADYKISKPNLDLVLELWSKDVAARKNRGN